MSNNFTRDLEAEVKRLQQREVELQRELGEISPTLKRYEKALALLVDEPQATPITPVGVGTLVPRQPIGRPRTTTPKRDPKTRKVSAQVLTSVKQVILNYLRADNHERFRQVDIRAINGMTSSQSTMAFNQLEEAGFLEFVVQEGTSKWYRLTQETLNSLPARTIPVV